MKLLSDYSLVVNGHNLIILINKRKQSYGIYNCKRFLVEFLKKEFLIKMYMILLKSKKHP